MNVEGWNKELIVCICSNEVIGNDVINYDFDSSAKSSPNPELNEVYLKLVQSLETVDKSEI